MTWYVVHYSYQRFQDWLYQARLDESLAEPGAKYVYVSSPEQLRGLNTNQVLVLDLPFHWNSEQIHQLRENLNVLDLLS